MPRAPVLFKSQQQGKQDCPEPAVPADERMNHVGKHNSTFIFMVGNEHELESLQSADDRPSEAVDSHPSPLKENQDAACDEKRIRENSKVAEKGPKQATEGHLFAHLDDVTGREEDAVGTGGHLSKKDRWLAKRRCEESGDYHQDQQRPKEAQVHTPKCR